MSDRRLSPPTMAQLLARPSPADPTWEDFAPFVDKCAALVKLNKNRAEAKAFATRYSDPRPEDDILALFCDGSATDSIPVGVAQARSGGKPSKVKIQNRKWASSGVAYKKNTFDKGWERRGYPGECLWSSTNAEIDGFGRATALAEGRLGVDFTVEKVFCFSDSMNVLNVILDIPQTRKLPNWDLSLLLEVMKGLVRLSERPGIEVELHWVPSHCGVEGNEEADKAAASARPDVLWSERYPVVTSNINKSRKLGYIAAATATTNTTTTITTAATINPPHHSIPAQKYIQQRQNTRRLHRTTKKVAALYIDVDRPMDEDPSTADVLGKNYWG